MKMQVTPDGWMATGSGPVRPILVYGANYLEANYYWQEAVLKQWAEYFTKRDQFNRGGTVTGRWYAKGPNRANKPQPR